MMTTAENVILDRQTFAQDRKRAAKGYGFRLLSEMDRTPRAKPWLIKGVIALGETSAWIAPPGAMKSALMAQVSICIAAGLDWHGRRNKRAMGVLYFAIERADLVERRIVAHCSRLDLGSLPIAVVNSAIELTKPGSFNAVVETIREAEAAMGVQIGFVIFDTFAKLIAIGGGDENQAAHQGAVFANVQKVKNLTGVHVAIVGHTGKDTTRGARGSNAFLGDVDLMVEIAGGSMRTATVTKANDAPEGVLFAFTSEIFSFGLDEDGDEISVNIVSAETPATPTATGREPKLTANQKTMFGVLRDAGAAGLETADWNRLAKEAGIGVRRHADHHDLRSALKAKGLIRESAGRWFVRHHGPD